MPPTTYRRAPSSDWPGPGSSVGRNRPHLEHPVGQHEVDPGRDLEVDLVAGHGHDAGPGHMPQDQAAVVGRGEIARGRGRGIRLGEDALAEDLRGLTAPIAGPVGDLDDPIAVDDDERVGARDDRVRRIGGAAGDGLDGADDHVDGHERPDGVVDDHDVVIVRLEAQQAVAGALVPRQAAADDRRRDGQPGPGDDAPGLLEPVRDARR